MMHSLQAAQQVGESPSQVTRGLNLFQVAQLISSYPRQLVWSQSLLYSLSCLRAPLSSLYCLLMEEGA